MTSAGLNHSFSPGFEQSLEYVEFKFDNVAHLKVETLFTNF